MADTNRKPGPKGKDDKDKVQRLVIYIAGPTMQHIDKDRNKAIDIACSIARDAINKKYAK